MIYKFITLSNLIVFCSSNLVFSQDDVISQNTKPVKAPIKEDQTYIIKFDPTRIILWEGKISNHTRSVVSELGLGLEKKIGTHSSFEFELGATRYDYAFEPVGARDVPDDDYYQTLHYNVASKLGFYSSLAYRYYPIKQALRGVYVSPKFRYRLLKDEVTPKVSDIVDSREESHKEFFYMINLGYETWLSDNYSLDFYIGVGMRSKISNFNHCYWSYNSKTNSSTLNWISSSTKEILPNINLGVKIGFGN